MPDIRAMAKDPDFQQLPIEEQRKAFSEYDEDFAALSVAEQDKGIMDLIGGSKEIVTPQVPQKSFGGLITNAATEVPQIAKGVWETAKTAGMLMNPTYRDESGQTGSDRVIGMVKNIPSSLADTAINAQKAIREKGFGQSLYDYAYEKPLTTALNVSGGLGLAGKAAGLGGFTRTANVLDKASLYTNPVTVAAKPITMGVDAVVNSQLPERLYASAAKLPLSKKWVQQLPREEMNARQRAVTAGLEGEVPVSEYGATKAKNISGSSMNTVDSLIDDLTTQGVTVNVDTILQNGLKDAYGKALASNNPTKATKYIDDFAETYRTEKGMEMTPSGVQENKRFNQKQNNYFNQGNVIGEHAQIDQSIHKGMAHATMQALEDIAPELKNLNRTTAAYKDLETAITRAYSRENNTNMVKLGSKVLIGSTHPVFGVLDSVLGLPWVKSKFAIALNKARKIHIPSSTTGNLINVGYQVNNIGGNE